MMLEGSSPQGVNDVPVQVLQFWYPFLRAILYVQYYFCHGECRKSAQTNKMNTYHNLILNL